ncbi:MAG: zinc-ribbon domain-containing protein [Acutalibacteraceae bacterium]|nr:zinc ribbon domain-containing protein [Bacillota bacterium]
MFCPHCGNSIADNTKFCPFCGASTGASDAAAPQTNPTASYSDPYASQAPTNTPPTYTPPQQPSTPPSYMPNFNAAGLAKVPKAKYTNIVAIIAAVVFFISMFLPFISASAMGFTQSATFMDCIATGDPLLVIMILFMIVIIILQAAKAPQAATIVLAALSLIFLLIEVGVANSMVSDYSSMGVSVSYSFGFWLMLLAHIAILASGPIHKAVVKK